MKDAFHFAPDLVFYLGKSSDQELQSLPRCQMMDLVNIFAQLSLMSLKFTE